MVFSGRLQNMRRRELRWGSLGPGQVPSPTCLCHLVHVPSLSARSAFVSGKQDNDPFSPEVSSQSS